MSEFHNGEKHQKAEAFISFRKRSWLSDPIKNLLSEAQRAEIGAIGLASQALIKALDPLLPLSIANGLFLELIKRQAGNTPEKIKWMILGLTGLPISNSLRDGIKKSLDAAKHFFHLRHSVIHCDLLDSTTGIYQ